MQITDDPKFQEYLAKEGWTIECESPLEIRHEEGSFATMRAAKVLLTELESQYKEEFGNMCPSTEDYPHQKNFETLTSLFSSMEQYIQTCYEQERKDVSDGRDLNDDGLSSTSYDLWKNTYSLVFSEKISRQINQIFKNLDIDSDYYDPDTSYKDDVLAYYNSVKDKMETLDRLISPSSKKMKM